MRDICPEWSLRPHGPSSESAEAPFLLKLLANIFRECELWTFIAPALSGRRGALAAAFAAFRSCQIGVKVASWEKRRCRPMEPSEEPTCTARGIPAARHLQMGRTYPAGTIPSTF